MLLQEIAKKYKINIKNKELEYNYNIESYLNDIYLDIETFLSKVKEENKKELD